MNQTSSSFWPQRLPRSLIYPQVPLFDFLETSARRYPDHPAVIYYGRRITYAELWHDCLRLAGALAGLGVKKGDRVALYLQNSPLFIVSFFGVMRTNATVVPLNPMLVAEEFKRLLEDSQVEVVITSTDLYPRVADICGELGIREIIVGAYQDYLPDEAELEVPELVRQSPGSIEGGRQWSKILAQAPSPPEVTVGPEDLCLLPYTAGSTGIPKGCRHTHATVVANAVGAYHWFNYTPASVCLGVLPFFHVSGMMHSLIAPIVAGATSVVLTRWDRETALQAIERYRCSHWLNISTMMIDFLAAPKIEKRNLRSLMVVFGGGATLPVAVGENLERLTGLTYVEGYGLTETISQTHFNPPDAPRLGSGGIAHFGVDGRIIDLSTLKEVGPGEEGELVVNGPMVFDGYWNKPQETEEAFIDLSGQKFFRTGDICRLDEQGYLYVIDRVKRMINAAGYKVWPTEVEAVLYRHPAVLEVCVIGTFDPNRGENVKALIVPRPEFNGKVSPEEIIDWSKGQMSAYKYPRIVEFVNSLPKSGAGKILWRQLQEEELKRASE